jgi:hypothetical protein
MKLSQYVDAGLHSMDVEAQNGLSEARLRKQCRASRQRLGPRLGVRCGASEHRECRGAGVPNAGFMRDA